MEAQPDRSDDYGYSNRRDTIAYEDDRIYFPGKTNENEVNLKRLNNALNDNKYFINENHSNRIDDDETVWPSNIRRTHSIFNVVKGIVQEVTLSTPNRKSSDTNRSVNDNNSKTKTKFSTATNRKNSNLRVCEKSKC